MRRGSDRLPPHLRQLGASVIEGYCNSDVEFLGSTPLGPLTPIGIEHKSAVTGDIFTSMTDGRLNGTQMQTMVSHYPYVRYLIIEGNLRRSKDGILEIFKFDRGSLKYDWQPAYSRNGAGWTYDEFENRIESIIDAFSEPNSPGHTVVKRTYDINESAAYIVGRYHYWQKPYEQHSSARQWDRSKRLIGEAERAEHPLMGGGKRTKDIELVRLWANDIDGIGLTKSYYVARHFRTPIALALATEDEWLSVVYKDKRATKDYHFSRDTVREIMKQIGTYNEEVQGK